MMTLVKDYAEQIRGVSYKPEDVCEELNDESITLLRANNITDSGLCFDDLVYVRRNKVKDVQKLQIGDVLICTSSGSKALVGKAAYVTKDMDMTFGAFCKVIRPHGVNTDYFQYFFQSPAYRKRISELAAGANINNIRNEHIDGLAFYLPDIPTQQRIADTLDKVSEGIEVCRKMLGKLDLMVKAKFVEMFGDPIINPMHYPVHQLAEYIRFLTSGSRGWAKYYSDEGEWFITIKNVKNCNISVDDVQCITPPQNAEANRTRLKEGDLLISITADLGRTGVVTKEIAEHGAYNNQHLTCIRLDQSALVPLYVAYFMESSAGKAQFEAKNMSAVKAGLNFDAIRSLKLIVPPLEQQNQFVLFVTQIKKSQLTIRGILDKMEMEKLALMQEFFNTGI